MKAAVVHFNVHMKPKYLSAVTGENVVITSDDIRNIFLKHIHPEDTKSENTTSMEYGDISMPNSTTIFGDIQIDPLSLDIQGGTY